MLAGRTFHRERWIAVDGVWSCIDIGDVLENAEPHAAFVTFKAAGACDACACVVRSYFRYAGEPAPFSGHLALHCWAIDLVLDPDERLSRSRRSQCVNRIAVKGDPARGITRLSDFGPCALSATMSTDAHQALRDDSVTATAAGFCVQAATLASRRSAWSRARAAASGSSSAPSGR